MSTAVFAQPPGTTYPVTRTPVWDTIVQQAISGKETRIAKQSYPRWKYELTINVLRSAAAYASTEYQYVTGFFNSRLGQFDTFLYQDPDDNSVASQGIGTGNGLTSEFQLARAFGGFVEPVLAPNTLSAVYLAGISIPSSGYTQPTNGALSASAAGALGATTYYVVSTWVTNSGETLAAVETSLAVGANHVLVVAAPSSPPAGAIGWNVYVSNTGGGGSGFEKLQDSYIPIGTAWTEPTTGLIAGNPPPVANTTGWSIGTWGGPNPGILFFGANVLNGVVITADFSYYWPCRMSADDLATSLIFQGTYEIKKFTFITCKN